MRFFTRCEQGLKHRHRSVSIKKCSPDKGLRPYLTQFDNYIEMFVYNR